MGNVPAYVLEVGWDYLWRSLLAQTTQFLNVSKSPHVPHAGLGEWGQIVPKLPVTAQGTEELPQNPWWLHVEPWPLPHRQKPIVLILSPPQGHPSNTDNDPEENRSSVHPLSPLLRFPGHPGNSQSAKLPWICNQIPALDVGEMHHACGTWSSDGLQMFQVRKNPPCTWHSGM